MEKLVDTHELERELRATLSAQREMGPNYDHHLVQNFMQKVNQQGFAPMPAPMPIQQQQTPPNVAVALRLVLAILSLIFMIPLAAITTSANSGGLAALFIVAGVVLGINFAFNRHH
ncbi:MAG TPA: hypothetical protein VKT82_12370 [Ktedonobacterales bacterium]|nr:hypothetical protein [Ktedonobacterales bacterium]